MKKIIIIVLVLGSSFTTSAQKIEVGINGGVMPYFETTMSPTTETSPYASVRGALNSRGWQAGLGVEHFQLQTTFTSNAESVDHLHNSYGMAIFGNKLFRLPKSYIYTGINGGYNSGRTTRNQNLVPHTGFNLGLQAGYTLNIAKGFGINAEVAARYNRVYYGDMGMFRVYMTVPVSLGLRYTF